MQNIEIIERVKNSKGEITGYTIWVCNSEMRFFISARDLHNVVSYGIYQVVNAILTVNGIFRAKPGYRIKTVAEYKLIGITHQSDTVSPEESIDFPGILSYYGREFIGICRKIRKLAIQGKVIVTDVDETYSSDADHVIHFIKLIKSCGVDVKEFARGYLSVIQPYLFETFQMGLSGWNIDIGFRVQLVLKLREGMDGDYLVVSFCESTQVGDIGGVTRISQISGEKDFSDKLCAVIVDNVSGWSEMVGGGMRTTYIIFTLQRSFIRSTIEISTEHINKGIALVKYSRVKELYEDRINHVLNGLQEIYFMGSVEQELRLSGFRVFFLGYKYSVANNICLLLDFFDTYTDSLHRSVILEITNDLLSKIPIESVPELRAAFEDKYGRIIGHNESELYEQILLCCGEE